jgi:DNA-binding transcriptional LysR family regulator
MKYSIDHLATFLYVNESGSFTKAADNMGLSKAIVSQRISALETHLKTQLFTRTTRRLNITDAGKDLYHNIRDSFTHIEAAIDNLKSHQSEAKGCLKVTMPAGFARALRSSAIPNFMKKNKELELQINIVEDPYQHLNSDSDCIIIGSIKGTSLPDLNMIAKKLATIPVGIFATAEYLREYGTPKKPHDLVNHNCLAAFSGPWPFKEKNENIFYIKTSGRVRANNDEIVKNIVLNDMAISYSYMRLFEKELSNKKVKQILKTFTHLEIELYALYPKSYYLPHKLRAFLDMIDKHYKK